MLLSSNSRVSKSELKKESLFILIQGSKQVLWYSHIIKAALQGGSEGACAVCTPAFLPSPGNSYIRKEIVHAFYFPWNSPPRAPLLSRLNGRPCISYSTLDHFWATWPDSHLTFSKIACYLRWESKGPGPKGLAVWAWAKGVWGNGQRGLS